MLRPNNLKCGGKKKKQEGGKIDMSQFYNQPVSSPFKSEPQQGYNNRIEEGIAKGILDIERQEGDSLLDSYNAVNEKKTPATPKHWDQSLGIGMMALRGLTSEIAGRVARGRQNQYDYMQQAALGQMNPMPATDYQPNPYSLYAKYGGSLKKYQQGGRAPIIVTDKNDPRLRAYNDSLNLYNANNLYNQEASNILKTSKTDKEYSTRMGFNIGNIPTPTGILGKANNEINKILNNHRKWQPISNIDPGYKIWPDGIKRNLLNTLEYKKPVQPVVFQKQPEEKKLEKPSAIPRQALNFSTGDRPQVGQQNLPQPYEWDNTKPTKYSFSYPTGKYNEQKSIYFPDAGSWKEFIGNQKLINSDEGEGYGTATGYMQMGGLPFNGNIRKMKNVTINNYGNQPMLQNPMDNLTAMIGTENPDFMSMLQGMRSMKYGGLQHVNYFGPPFSNGAEMKMGDEDKMDVKAAHSVMSKMLRGFKKGGLTPNKAREILHDGTAQGHPLTDKQRRFFGAKSKGHTNYRDK